MAIVARLPERVHGALKPRSRVPAWVTFLLDTIETSRDVSEADSNTSTVCEGGSEAFALLDSDGRDHVFKWLDRFIKSNVCSAEVIPALLAEPDGLRRSRALFGCGAFLLFEHGLTSRKNKLRAANFCKQEKLCRACAARRGGKLGVRYMDRVESVLSDVAGLRVHLLTLTLRDGADLGERVDVLNGAFRALLARGKKNRQRGNSGGTEARHIVGGARSIEVKRGSGSGLWHPHIHALILTDGEIDKAALFSEWAHLVGQEVGETMAAQDLRPIDFKPGAAEQADDVAGAFLEVFKYAVKLSDMTPADRIHADAVLRSRRLVQGFGVMYGVKVPPLEDDALENEAFVELVFHRSRAGYDLAAAAVKESR